MKFINSKKVFLSVIASSLVFSVAQADIKEDMINIKITEKTHNTNVTYNDINKKGSLINSSFNFYQLPEVKIKLVKGYFDEKSNSSNLLFKVTNKTSKRIDAHRVLDLNQTSVDGFLEANEEKLIVVTRHSLNNYLTKVGNEKFEENRKYIEMIKNNFSNLENDFNDLYKKQEKTEVDLKVQKVKVSEYKTNENRINSGLNNIITNFSKKEISLASTQLFGDKDLDFNTLDLDRKYSLIVVLINDYVDSLAKYRINVKTSELLEQNSLLIYKSQKLSDELESLKTSSDEFKESLGEGEKLENIKSREEFLLEAVVIYKNRINEIKNLKIDVDNLTSENKLQKQKIKEIEEENHLLKAKLYNDKLDVDKSRIDLLEKKLRLITLENQDLTQNSKDRKYQHSLTLENVSNLESDNENLIKENLKLQKKIDELKKQVIEIRSLI